MRRRTVVRRTAAVGVAMVAGCMGDQSSSGRQSDNRVSINGDPSFTVHDSSPSEGKESADVVFDADQLTVVVEGTITGKNGCMTAALQEAVYDSDAGELAVSVGTKRATDASDVCTQALHGISYTAGIEFENGLPDIVTVVHDGQGGSTTVTTAER